jgi:ankyrin repeat protein
MASEALTRNDYTVESKDDDSQTPLSRTAMEGHEAVVKLLLEKGAELESKDSDFGMTPLLQAAMDGHEAVVKLLLEKGAELESKDKTGRTPLSRAAENGHEAVVKLLLKKGAETTSVVILSLLQRARVEDAAFSPLAISATSRTLSRPTAPVVEPGKG